MQLPRTSIVAFALWTAVSEAAPVQSSDADPFAVLDPQEWVNPDDMTWDDYVRPPGTTWNDPSRKGSIRNFKIALVTVDYPDLNFTVTKAPNSTFWGNPLPLIANLKREEVPSYYHDLLNKPQELNHNHTLHEYWMEDSGGRYGVELTAFGAYRLPRKSFQYGVDDEEGGFNPGACPEEPCSVDLRTDALGAWRKDVGNATADSYELAFILSAGQDESSTWQEFGEMKFQTKQDVTDPFGPPGDTSLPNYAKTRYVEWTAWQSAACIWPNAGGGSSTQAESSGAATYAHELSHLLSIGDNYNNPFSVPARRSYTGPWSMMSRGSFNGPGGPHTRWQIPAVQGASLGSEHTVRDKLQLKLTDNTSVLNITRTALTSMGGTVVARITARSVEQGAGGLKGLRVNLDNGGDLSPRCNTSTNPLCDGGGFNFFDAEVIDRMGADSFTPDAGVMISKGKTSDRVQPFQWVIDANPQDIGVVDFIRPNGTAAYVTIGDYRQLADALFHAGTRSGSEFEFEDKANGLHFYIIEPFRDSAGVLSYSVGVRSSTAAKSASKFDVKLGKGKVSSEGSVIGKGATCSFELTNKGKYKAGTATSKEIEKYLKSDVFRLSAEVDGAGWTVALPNALATAEFDKKIEVKVAVKADGKAKAKTTVKLTAVSESDGKVKASGNCEIKKS